MTSYPRPDFILEGADMSMLDYVRAVLDLAADKGFDVADLQAQLPTKFDDISMEVVMDTMGLLEQAVARMNTNGFQAVQAETALYLWDPPKG